jgi:hypothetical protein
MNEASSEYYFSSRRYSNFAKNFVDVRTRCWDVFPSPGPIGYMLSKIPPACLSECVKPHHFSPCYLQRTQLERPTPTHSSIFTHTKFIPYLTCFPQHSLLWQVVPLPSWFPPRTCRSSSLVRPVTRKGKASPYDLLPSSQWSSHSSRTCWEVSCAPVDQIHSPVLSDR